MPEATVVDNTTRFINVQTDEYPVYLTDIKNRHKNVIWGQDTESITAYLGYAVVHPTPEPQGDVVYEGIPVIQDDLYVQVWVVRDFTAEETEAFLRVNKETTLGRIENLLEKTLDKGCLFNFGTEEEPNYQHIQLRDKDRANHTGMSVKHTRDPSLAQPFRTLENNNMVLPGEQVVRVTDASYAGYLDVLQKVWALKDQTRQATTSAEIPVVSESLEDFYTNHLNWTWIEV